MSDKSAVQAFEAYTNDYVQQLGLDFSLFHSPQDVHAPHPDLFEADLEVRLAALDPSDQVNLLQQQPLLTVDPTEIYSIVRSDACGSPSTITASSESAYNDSLSAYSESFYNYTPAFYALEMDFQNIRVNGSDYEASLGASTLPTTIDPTSFGRLPPTPPRSPEMHSASPAKSFDVRTSFSDYGPPTRPSPSFDYQNQLGYSPAVTPSNAVSNTARLPSSTPESSTDEAKPDPRKKFRCTTCTRAFARAYNLKTHMATHDPNRLKPHVCPHRACGRAFSRKHDLERHKVSLHGTHKADREGTYQPVRKGVGVDQAARCRCDNCGKSFPGRPTICTCEAGNT